MKKILIVSYSQSGQLSNLVKNLIEPLENEDDIELTHNVIEPVQRYPYPWNFVTFMDTFPEAVLLKPCEIKEIPEDNNEYDLVILAYTVWFLSPSIPITAFLKSDYAKSKLNNTPVITVIACRNMWIMAQKKVTSLLDNINAKLIDNIVLIDEGHSLATFITTPRWMLTGKKNSFWGLPKAGINENELLESKKFGKAILHGLRRNMEKSLIPLCKGLGAVNVDVKLVKSEEIATKSFTIWAKLITFIGKPGDKLRILVVLTYLIFLILMILTVVPINMIVQTINRKINKKKVEKMKCDLELPSTSEINKIKDFHD